MKEKKSDTNGWLNKGTKNGVFVIKILAVVISIYIIYQLGYAFGTFLAHIRL